MQGAPCTSHRPILPQTLLFYLVRMENQTIRTKGGTRWERSCSICFLSAGVYLRSNSQSFVARRRKGNRRRYSCPAARCLRAEPMRLAIDISELHASREIYLQFSRAGSRNIARSEALHDSRGKNRTAGIRVEFKALDIKVSAYPEMRPPHTNSYRTSVASVRISRSFHEVVSRSVRERFGDACSLKDVSFGDVARYSHGKAAFYYAKRCVKLLVLRGTVDGQFTSSNNST